MKKLLLLGLISWMFAPVALADDFAPECEALVKKIREVGEETPALADELAKFDREVTKARDQWDDLSAQEKALAAKQCAKLSEQLEEAVNVLKALQVLNKVK
ncbi:hypothetical protein L0B52_04155 [Suttonella sp. R2A3]|uniref:hypothetical protein n=1 Tax=Suttonella sp. R2A3 TaxID=2908648 RepID=UPI001F3A983A|nr:hypothetical protein [Suttonella sp. R2A3]UJF25346.1 hypothetical protein L0B52_04155 [Suttonella sp. R2A3]